MYPTIDVCNSNCMTFEHVFIECLYADERLQLNENKSVFKCPCICVNSTLWGTCQTLIFAPLHINGSQVERVSCFRFLRVHISDDFSWSAHTDKVVKAARKVLLLEETEEVWHGVSHPHKLLQMHDKEHLTGCISVVRELQIYYLGTSFSSDLAHLTFV